LRTFSPNPGMSNTAESIGFRARISLSAILIITLGSALIRCFEVERPLLMLELLFPSLALFDYLLRSFFQPGKSFLVAALISFYIYTPNLFNWGHRVDVWLAMPFLAILLAVDTWLWFKNSPHRKVSHWVRLLLFLSLINALIVSLFNSRFTPDWGQIGNMPVYVIALQALDIVFVTSLCIYFWPLLKERFKPAWIWSVLAIGVAILGRLMSDLYILYPIESWDEIRLIGFSRLPEWHLMVYNGFFAPVMEELFYRGILLGIGWKLMGRAAGIHMAALIFALAHQHSNGQIWIYGMGVLLGWLRLKSGSMWPPIIAHLAFNWITMLR
jgi:membrane protease YdiL (CAAX protease family)